MQIITMRKKRMIRYEKCGITLHINLCSINSPSRTLTNNIHPDRLKKFPGHMDTHLPTSDRNPRSENFNSTAIPKNEIRQKAKCHNYFPPNFQVETVKQINKLVITQSLSKLSML